MYNFNITLITKADDVRSIKIMTFYDFILRDRIRLDMVSMAYLNIDLPIGGSDVFVYGDLKFV